MAEVSHTPPHGDTETGTRLFSRGLGVATDGGDRPDGEGTADGPASADRATGDGDVPSRPSMAEVDHTPPDGDGAVRVWDRGLPKPGVHVSGDR